jgi:hypothetical protein
MIIVKDKGAKSQIYIQRNNVTNLQNNSGGSEINKAELDKYLKNYATKEYVDDSVIELTKADYEVLKSQGKVSEKNLYLITDSTIPLKKINGESLVGDGNIDLSNYATKEYVDKLIGDFESITDIIIGEVNTIIDNIIGE